MRKEGLFNTTMDMVAQDTGIARPHLYRYFKDKAALVSAVLAAEAASINIERLKRLRGVTDPAEKIIRSFESVFDVVHGNPFWSASVSPINLPLSAEAMLLDPVIHDIREEYWGPILDAAADAGRLREGLDREQTLSWLISLEFLFIDRRELFTRGEDVRPYVEAFVLPALLKV